MKPMSLDSEDGFVHEPPIDTAHTRAMSDLERVRVRQARNAVRRFRQGQRFFRLYTSRGPRVEVLSVEAKQGKAVVDGKRGVFTVALCDLLPDAR